MGRLGRPLQCQKKQGAQVLFPGLLLQSCGTGEVTGMVGGLSPAGGRQGEKQQATEPWKLRAWWPGYSRVLGYLTV